MPYNCVNLKSKVPMLQQFDLIGIGECLIELYEVSLHTYKQSVAGDVFNTLYYASRLGLRTGFISTFGKDQLTANIMEVMDRERIDSACTSRSEKNNNGLYMISHDENGEAEFSFWRDDSAAKYILKTLDSKKILEYILSAKYFHSSAIALAVLSDTEHFLSFLKKAHRETILTFDTNYRKNLWKDMGRLVKFIEDAAQVIDFLFVSATDDFHIFGNRTPLEAVKYYSFLGYKNIIFRQGAGDVLLHEDSITIKIPTVPNVEVVDTTAAGDAFNAGFISAHAEGKSLREAVYRGNECAAFVIGRKGGLAKDFRKENLHLSV
jgi:2-dehydro-3-deoxygluconokinase